jgi:hypothetical protein
MALHGTRGPVALLVHSGEQERLVRTYAAAAQAYVRVQVFDHADAADAWLTQALE